MRQDIGKYVISAAPSHCWSHLLRGSAGFADVIRVGTHLALCSIA